MALTLSTELDAINEMLSVIGEAPVNSTTNTGLIDAVMAKQILDRTSREVQSKGWHWNTNKAYTLTPDSDGYLNLPSTTLKVDPCDPTIDAVQRGLKLWDRVNNTYVFEDDVDVDIVVGLDFDQLPQSARTYISIRAARIFQDRVVGSETLSGFNDKDEESALVTLLQDEAENADYNMLTDNWDVGQIIFRDY